MARAYIVYTHIDYEGAHSMRAFTRMDLAHIEALKQERKVWRDTVHVEIHDDQKGFVLHLNYVNGNHCEMWHPPFKEEDW